MPKKLTITVDAEVYDGLHSVIGRRRSSAPAPAPALFVSRPMMRNACAQTASTALVSSWVPTSTSSSSSSSWAVTPGSTVSIR